MSTCTNLKTLTEDIKNNKEKYNELAKTVYKCDFSRFSYGQNIGNEYFPKILVDALNNTSLKDKVGCISLYKSPYCENTSFNLYINPTLLTDVNGGNYTIWYDQCPKDNIYLNEEKMDEWRIDNNWSITKHYR